MNEQEDLEAEQLEAFLAASQNSMQPVSPAALPSGEAGLAKELLELSAAAKPAAGFVQALEKRLAAEADRQRNGLDGEYTPRKARWAFGRLKKPLPSRLFLIAAGTLILALLAYFGLQLPKTGQAARLPSLNGSGQGAGGSGSLLGGAEFILQASLPDVPASLPVYQQPAPKELTVSEVRDLAGRFGFSGTVYLQKMPELAASSGGSQRGFPSLPTVYAVFDGQRQLQITNQSIQYSDAGIPNSVWLLPALPFDQAAAIARQFLTGRGLLDFSYNMVQDPYSANVVDFVVMAGQWPVANLNTRVLVTPDGRVASVSYSLIDLKPLTEYPIHSASEAWTALQSGTTPGRWMQMTTSSQPGSAFHGPLEIWGADYAPIQDVEVTGSVEVYLPANGENAQPRLDLGSGNPRLEILPQDVQSLIDTNYRLVLLQGEIRKDDSGSLIFVVAGWKDAAGVQMKNVQGVIVRKDGNVFLRQADGSVFLLPLAPGNLPDGTSVSMTAWDTNRSQDGYPVLGWNSIETPPQPAPGGNPAGAAAPAVGSGQPTAESQSPLNTPAPLSGAVTVEVSTPAPAIEVPGSPALSGKAYVDKVELIYVVTPADPNSRTPAESILQPAWRFSGHTDSGEKFEILFQAVLENYLN